MLLSLHDGLLQALASEQHAAAASALLQALQALLRGAPYHRLPGDLLLRTLEVQHELACRQAVLQGGLRTTGHRLFCAERPGTTCREISSLGGLHAGILPHYRVLWEAVVQQMWAAGSIGDLLARTQEVHHDTEHCCGKQACCMHACRQVLVHHQIHSFQTKS